MAGLNRGNTKWNLLCILLLTALFLPFQNCSQTSIGKSSQSKASSGNGEPYSGITAQSGKYYYVVGDSFTCGNSLQTPEGNIAKTIEVFEDKEIVALTDNCSMQTIELPLSSITASAYTDKFVNLFRTVFQKLEAEELERPNLRRPVARCLDASAARVEYFIFRSVERATYRALVFESHQAPYRVLQLRSFDEHANRVQILSEDDKLAIQIDKEAVNSDSTYISDVVDTDGRKDSGESTGSTEPTTEKRQISCTTDRNPD